MKVWFLPWWSGDIRLERDGDGCVLTVEDPTPADREILEKFLPLAQGSGWLDRLSGVQPRGRTVLPLDAPMATVAPVLSGQMHGEHTTWTAVRFTGGKIEIAFEGPGFAESHAAPLVAQATAEAAVTVRQPNVGCPEPDACTRRASEVLRAFSTRTQWNQWQREGRMRVIGNVTGEAYHVYHADEAHRRGHIRCLVDSIGDPVCLWDASVPPEEQALSLKLAVEHREGWLRGIRMEGGRLW